MKCILIASLLSSAVYAAPFFGLGQGGRGNSQAAKQQGQQQQQAAQQGQQQAQNAANRPTGQTPTPADLATAVSNWQADTSMVSNFLNTGASIQNNVAFKQAATVALNAEIDELTHKAIIDAANGADPNVVAANGTLDTAGAFQDVVDRLMQMSVQGRAAAGNIELINQNRCVNVLPNIDAYFASTGSAERAVRPTVCDQTGVAGGVQGTGATEPGATPGTPAAAFAAARALTAGTAPQAAAPQQGQQQPGTVQGQTPTQGQQAQTPTQAQAGAQGQAQAQTPSQQGITPNQPQGVAAPSAGIPIPQQGQQITPQGQQAAQNGQLPPTTASPVAGNAAQQQAPHAAQGQRQQGQTAAGNGRQRQNAGAA